MRAVRHEPPITPTACACLAWWRNAPPFAAAAPAALPRRGWSPASAWCAPSLQHAGAPVYVVGRMHGRSAARHAAGEKPGARSQEPGHVTSRQVTRTGVLPFVAGQGSSRTGVQASECCPCMIAMCPVNNRKGIWKRVAPFHSHTSCDSSLLAAAAQQQQQEEEQ